MQLQSPLFEPQNDDIKAKMYAFLELFKESGLNHEEITILPNGAVTPILNNNDIIATFRIDTTEDTAVEFKLLADSHEEQTWNKIETINHHLEPFDKINQKMKQKKSRF